VKDTFSGIRLTAMRHTTPPMPVGQTNRPVAAGIDMVAGELQAHTPESTVPDPFAAITRLHGQAPF